ncbi:hypothetical protein [Corynebacterium belfantii]|uniref:hypothetical protein n=1 Tax=Corynebacterium belfantii TaxID=2014537 RepID=UPI001A2C38E3|nr:hypothetical protein [Corynebacterium belfantii]MBG9318539.1 hypothetical protein [Corynebacterium belfantii]
MTGIVREFSHGNRVDDQCRGWGTPLQLQSHSVADHIIPLHLGNHQCMSLQHYI